MDTEVIPTEKRTIVIPYRDGRIRKELHLKPNNQHDMLFYDSYKRLPSDNRNYMASLYAREQRYGVNDDIGHRVQELALKNPTENDVILRERRTVEKESLNETLAAAEKQLNELKLKKQRTALSETDMENEKRLTNEVASLKRRIRGLDMNYSRLLNMQMAKTGQPLASMATDKTDLKNILHELEEIIGKRMTDVLDDFVDKLPANASPDKDNMNYVKANVAFLQSILDGFGIAHNDILDSITAIYAFLSKILDYTLTQHGFDRQYTRAMEHLVTLNQTIRDIYNNQHAVIDDTKLDVGIESTEHLWVSILAGLGVALEKTLKAASENDSDKYNNIKGIYINDPNYKEFSKLVIGSADYTKSDEYKNAEDIEPNIVNKIRRAAIGVYKELEELKDPIQEGSKRQYVSLQERVQRLNEALADGITDSREQARIYGAYDLSTNQLTLNRFTLKGTNYEVRFDIQFNNALTGFQRRKKNGSVATSTNSPRYNTVARINDTSLGSKDTFGNRVSREAARQLGPQVLTSELTGKLLTPVQDQGQGVTYKAPSEEDERFNRIVEMGNPLKKVRSQRYYRMD